MSEHASSSPSNTPRLVQLVSPNIPADQGLSSLGLLLQLGGSLTAAFTCLVGFAAVLAKTRAGGGAMLGALLLTVLGVVRSLMHRAAGTGLIYGPQPLRGIRRYAVVGLVHSALLGASLASPLYGLSMRMSLGVALAFAVWPALLLAFLRLPRFARYEEELPMSEDKGFEAAAVLMTILGLAGLAIGGSVLWAAFHTPGAMKGLGALLVLTLALLVLRSVVHVSAGIAGLDDAPLDLAVERVGRYANLGIASALVACGVLFLSVIGSHADFAAILSIAVLGWMLAAWPTILRRYFAERQFASMLAGADEPLHRRAPDAGLTGLGWLLISVGAVQLSFSVLGLLVTEPAMVELRGFGTDGVLGLLIAVAHLGAGFELVRMSPQHRIAVTLVGIVSFALQASNVWPLWRSIVGASGTGDPAAYGILGVAVMPMITSLAMIALVHRKLSPMALARVRQPR